MHEPVKGDKNLVIDFHSHILPGIDDGSKSVEESIQMLTASREQGVDCVVLTPHFYADRWNPEDFFESRNSAFEVLSNASVGLGIKLVVGAEVEYFEGITAMEELREMRISGSSAVMIEMPFRPWSRRVIRDITEIAGRRSYSVILAHIERYIDYQDDSVIEELINAGVIMQANANSFSGFFKSQKCIKLLKNGLVHIIGSDCHNMTVRPPNLRSALNMIEEKCGSAVLQNMIRTGNLILFGE